MKNPLGLRDATYEDIQRSDEVLRQTKNWNSANVALALAIVLNDRDNLEKIIARQRVALGAIVPGDKPDAKTLQKYWGPQPTDEALTEFRTKYMQQPIPVDDRTA